MANGLEWGMWLNSLQIVPAGVYDDFVELRNRLESQLSKAPVQITYKSSGNKLRFTLKNVHIINQDYITDAFKRLALPKRGQLISAAPARLPAATLQGQSADTPSLGVEALMASAMQDAFGAKNTLESAPHKAAPAALDQGEVVGSAHLISEASYTVTFEVDSNVTLGALDFSDLTALSGNTLSVQKETKAKDKAGPVSPQEKAAILDTLTRHLQFSGPKDPPDPAISVVNASLFKDQSNVKLALTLNKALQPANLYKPKLLALSEPTGDLALLRNYVTAVKENLTSYLAYLNLKMQEIEGRLKAKEQGAKEPKRQGVFTKTFKTLSKFFNPKGWFERFYNDLDRRNWVSSELGLVNAELAQLNACLSDGDKIKAYLSGHYDATEVLTVSAQRLGDLEHLLQKHHHILSNEEHGLTIDQALQLLDAIKDTPISVLNIAASQAVGAALQDPQSNRDWWKAVAGVLNQSIQLKGIFFNYPPIASNGFLASIFSWINKTLTGQNQKVYVLTVAEKMFLMNLKAQDLEVVRPVFQELAINRSMVGYKVSDYDLTLLGLDGESFNQRVLSKLQSNFRLVQLPVANYEVAINPEFSSVTRFYASTPTSSYLAQVNQVITRNKTYQRLQETLAGGEGGFMAILQCINLDVPLGSLRSFLNNLDSASRTQLISAARECLLDNLKSFSDLIGSSSINVDLLLEFCNEIQLASIVANEPGSLPNALFKFTNRNQLYEFLTNYLLTSSLDISQKLQVVYSWPDNYRDEFIKRYLNDNAAEWIKQHRSLEEWMQLYHYMSQGLQQRALEQIAASFLRLEDFSLDKTKVVKFLAFLLKRPNEERIAIYLKRIFEPQSQNQGGEISGFTLTLWHQQLLEANLGGYQELNFNPGLNTKNFIKALRCDAVIKFIVLHNDQEAGFNARILSANDENLDVGLPQDPDYQRILAESIQKLANLGGFSREDLLNSFSQSDIGRWINKYGLPNFLNLLKERADAAPDLMASLMRIYLDQTGRALSSRIGRNNIDQGIRAVSGVLVSLLNKTKGKELVLKALTEETGIGQAFFLNNKIKAFDFFSRASRLLGEQNQALVQVLDALNGVFSLAAFDIQASPNNNFGVLENHFCDMLLKKVYQNLHQDPNNESRFKDLMEKVFKYLANPASSDSMKDIYSLAVGLLGKDQVGQVLVDSLDACSQSLETEAFKRYVARFLTSNATLPARLIVNINQDQAFTNAANRENYEWLLHFKERQVAEELRDFFYIGGKNWSERLPNMLNIFSELNEHDAQRMLSNIGDLPDHISLVVDAARDAKVLSKLVVLLSKINEEVRLILLNHLEHFNEVRVKKEKGAAGKIIRNIDNESDKSKRNAIINWLLTKIGQESPGKSQEAMINLVATQLITRRDDEDSALQQLKDAGGEDWFKLNGLVTLVNEQLPNRYQHDWAAFLQTLGLQAQGLDLTSDQQEPSSEALRLG